MSIFANLYNFTDIRQPDIERPTNRQADKYTDKYMGGQTNKWTDKVSGMLEDKSHRLIDNEAKLGQYIQRIISPQTQRGSRLRLTWAIAEDGAAAGRNK